ncbi:hypothetical protein J6590_031716 [Homalodisca vitripennis]|nr:hypothetical protein J6590_031716 [Homalodisca vitripennis]
MQFDLFIGSRTLAGSGGKRPKLETKCIQAARSLFRLAGRLCTYVTPQHASPSTGRLTNNKGRSFHVSTGSVCPRTAPHVSVLRQISRSEVVCVEDWFLVNGKLVFADFQTIFR